MRRGHVSRLRVHREARSLEDPEHEHPCNIHVSPCERHVSHLRLTDGGRDEQWSPADLVAKQTRDDGDDEVIDVENAVLSYARVSSLHERSREGGNGSTHNEQLRGRVGDYDEMRRMYMFNWVEILTADRVEDFVHVYITRVRPP